jgi:hypothetical protein
MTDKDGSNGVEDNDKGKDQDEEKDAEEKESEESETDAKASSRDAEPDESEDAAASADEAPEERVAAKSARSPEARRKRPRTKGRVEKADPNAAVTRLAVTGVLALALGGAGGWFGHQAQASAQLRRDSAPAASGSASAASGPCGAWQHQICAKLGEQSAACEQAKSAADLLATSTCEAALTTVPATLEKVKAARAVCDKLVTKLCADLPPGSKTCSMVKERTPSFPPSRCEQMLSNYDQVIAQLKMMDQQGPMMGGGHPGMRGPGGPGGPGGPPTQGGPPMQGAPRAPMPQPPTSHP